MLKDKFIEIFGGAADDLRVFTAPGRVNLIGEHIDYNGGSVFPAALTMGTTLVARKRNDNIIRMRATDLDITVEVDTNRLDSYKDSLDWGAYQVGVAAQLQKEGHFVSGCDILYHDTLPHGAGLSSSAAIELSTALLFMNLAGDNNPDMIKAAQICQVAEHNFIGVKCGIMDQFASAMGKADHAICLDCATLSYEYVPINLSDYSIVITNTHKKHSLGASQYNIRRNECMQGLSEMQNVLPDITCLADVCPGDFEEYAHILSDDVIFRRLRHVITECDRVKQGVKALKCGNISLFGALMNLSHHSLKNDYEVSCVELDILAETAQALPYVAGSRMTGAGFGGCTVSLVKSDCTDEFKKELTRVYSGKTGITPSFYVSETGDGAREIMEL
ncbi:MAG: galactokinase [Clostridia bacterium]|nr:galactokinase [Clostridia bacterium]